MGMLEDSAVSIAASFAVASLNGMATIHMDRCHQLRLVLRGPPFCQRTTTAFIASQISQHFVSVAVFIYYFFYLFIYFFFLKAELKLQGKIQEL